MRFNRYNEAIILSIIFLLAAPIMAVDSSEKDLYSKPLESGRALVVTEGPAIPVEALPRELLEPNEDNPPRFMCSITIELRSPGTPTCRLWSGFGTLHEYKVLDALLLRNRIVLAIITESETIQLWSINLAPNGGVQIDAPPSAYWRALASGPLGELSCKLSFEHETRHC